jgi:hypothetical protein
MVRAFSDVPFPAFSPIKAVFKEKTVFISTTIGAIWEIHLRRGWIFRSNFSIISLLRKIIKKTLINNNLVFR